MDQESRFFRALFDDAPFPYQTLDSDERLLTVNRAWQEELGYEKHEVLGRSFGDFVSVDHVAKFREQFAQFVKDGLMQGVLWNLRRRDGSVLNASFSGRIVRDDNGRFLRSNCMFLDLDKRSEAEGQLRRSEEARMAFLESANEGFGLFDHELRLIYINPAGARIFDALPDELIGRTMSEISPGTRETERYARFLRVLETGEPFSIDAYAPPPEKLGQRWFSIQAFPVAANLGIILRDVTQAKRAEKQLQESEARWRALTEESPDLLMLLDTDLQLEYASAPLPGWTMDEMAGTFINHFAGDAQQKYIRETLERVLSTGKAATYETTHIISETETVYYESLAALRIVEGETVGLVVSSRDVSQHVRDKSQIEGLLKRQTAMAQLAVEFGEARAMHDIFRLAWRRVSGLMDARAFIISRFDASEKMIYAQFVALDGAQQDCDGFPPIPLEVAGQGTQSEVLRTGEAQIVPDYLASMANVASRYRISTIGQPPSELAGDDPLDDLPKSALLVPMKMRGDVIGVMQVQSNQPACYNEEDAELLSGLANITAVAIENHSLISSSRTTYEGVIRALAKAIELRDPYTSQHQVGVARIASQIAATMGLPDGQIRAVEVSGYIHDIGKIIIPAEILSKPTALSDAQMSIVRSHVLAAQEILDGIAFPWPIADIVCQHHERLDGSGYPAGVHGDEIRLESCILAVADVADAMLSHRPYRPACSLADVLDELKRQRGSTLNADAVDACLHVLKDRVVSQPDAA